MANPWSGEVEVVLDGRPYRARLTLGALAELEQALGEPSLVALVERFETRRFSGGDVLALLQAALAAGGNPVKADALHRAEFDGGPMTAARAAAELLARAFTVPE